MPHRARFRPRPCRHSCWRRFTVWLALYAMLGMSLLPTLAHALAHARGGAAKMVEVCTPRGMRLVAVDAGDAADARPAPLQAAGHLEHCPYCAVGAGAIGLPPAAPAVAALAFDAAALPALFLHAPRTLFAWRSAQPRGPPPVS